MRQRVIVGSSLFRAGRTDVDFARTLADAVGTEQIIAAVDSKGGRVVIKGWTEAVELTAVEAVASSNRSAASSCTPTSTKRG